MRPKAPPAAIFPSRTRTSPCLFGATIHSFVSGHPPCAVPLVALVFARGLIRLYSRASAFACLCVKYYHSDHTRDSEGNLRRRVLPEELQAVLPMSFLVRALDDT